MGSIAVTTIFGTPKLRIRSRFLASWLMIDVVKPGKSYHACEIYYMEWDEYV